MKKRQKKKHVVSNSESIPADLIFEIFSRLPAKSILRFRCLSKEWASILCSRNFTRSFSTKSRPRLLFTFHVDGKLFSYSAPQPRNPDQDLSHVVVVDNHMPILTRMRSVLIPPPVCGLLCPSSMWYTVGCRYSKMMTICNPSTGQIKNLPAARTKRSGFNVKTYLGYDPIKEVYKILCMSLSTGTYPRISQEHQVLTLGTGKPFWRMIECSLQQYPEIGGGICINGVLYYSAFQDNESGGGQDYIVICFDVSSEKFKPLEINLTSPTLVNYKGKLGAIQFDSVDFYDGITTSLSLMVLDDAEQHKWSKQTYILPPFWKNLGVDTCRLNVVGMTGDSEIVVSPSILSDPFYIFYYHLERNTTVKVRVQGIDFAERRYIYTFLDHVEDVKLM
ncbi:hypothetical protein Bca4012_035767 [Brassica carinata]|uniref:F-box domain-containing protein n=1 Tax=Brassica carinata TaxID=52824 RepID=A0A8X8BAE6_BRACI|nr:hypothetical protein Bca52824_009590 [Brassica carinata]